MSQTVEYADISVIMTVYGLVRGVFVRDKKEFIDFMAGAGVLLFGDFTAKSDRKTPYFVNTGNYKTGEHISKLGDWYGAEGAACGETFDALYGSAR